MGVEAVTSTLILRKSKKNIKKRRTENEKKF